MTARLTPERLAEIDRHLSLARRLYARDGVPVLASAAYDLRDEIDALRAEAAADARALDGLQAIVSPVVVESDDTLADVVRRLIAEAAANRAHCERLTAEVEAAVAVAEAARRARDASEPRVEHDPVLGRVGVSGGDEEFAADEALADALDAWEAR